MPRSRLAHPDDEHLTMRYDNVVIDTVVVFERDVIMPFTAPAGFGPVEGSDRSLSLSNIVGEFSGSYPVSTVQEGEFVWIIQQLDRWANEQTAVTFVAAPGRVSAFYGPDDTVVPFPMLVDG